MTGLSSRIREARKDRGLTQRQLAERIGCDRCVIGDWENDRQTPQLEFFKALCQALKVSADWLLFGSFGAMIEELECDRLEWRAMVEAERGPLGPDVLRDRAKLLLRMYLL